MSLHEEHDRIKALLTEAITVLCKNGLGYRAEFCIDGLLGITVDKEDVFLVKIHEKISRSKGKRSENRSDSASQETSKEENVRTPVSPTSTYSLSQPATPQNATNYQRENSYNGETVSRSTERVRKRPPDHGSPPHASKRRSFDNSSDPIVIKEEVLDSSDLQDFNAFSGENVSKMRQNLLARGDSYSMGPSTSRWPDGSINESSSSSTSNFPLDGENTASYPEMDPLLLPNPWEHERSMTLSYNIKGRLIRKGVPLDNSERQMVINMILASGADELTGQMPKGTLTQVATHFKLGASTVHNIWKRFWKYKVDTHGYCPEISDKKREINRRSKERAKQRHQGEASQENESDLWDTTGWHIQPIKEEVTG